MERSAYETVGSTSRIATPAEAASRGGDELAVRTPIGFVPHPQAINSQGLREPIDWNELLRIDHKWWLQETHTVCLLTEADSLSFQEYFQFKLLKSLKKFS